LRKLNSQPVGGRTSENGWIAGERRKLVATLGQQALATASSITITARAAG